MWDWSSHSLLALGLIPSLWTEPWSLGMCWIQLWQHLDGIISVTQHVGLLPLHSHPKDPHPHSSSLNPHDTCPLYLYLLSVPLLPHSVLFLVIQCSISSWLFQDLLDACTWCAYDTAGPLSPMLIFPSHPQNILAPPKKDLLRCILDLKHIN